MTASLRPPVAGRDSVLDAAKFLLVVLVVVGHAVEPLLEGRLIAAGYLFIYAFHMPLFVLLCGHFSKDLAVDDRRAGRVLTGIVLPYLIFETAYALFVAVLGGRRPEVSLLSPYWIMWFLFALAVWRTSMPYLARLRYPLLIAVVAALLVGFTARPGDDVIYRTVGLLPFFVLGYLLPAGFHLRLRDTMLRAVGAFVFFAVAAACWKLVPDLDKVWLYWRGSYASLGADGAEGPLFRLVLLVVALAMSLAFLAWVPDHPGLARLGQRSMYVFLLHAFVLLAARRLGWYAHVDSWIEVLAVIALAAALAAALSTGVVRRLLRPVVEPAGSWLLVRPADRARDQVTDLPAVRPAGGGGARQGRGGL